MRERDRSNQLSGCGSRIAAAIGIGVLVGCVFVFMFPNGFLSSSNPPTDVIRPLFKSNLEMCGLSYAGWRASTAFGQARCLPELQKQIHSGAPGCCKPESK